MGLQNVSPCYLGSSWRVEFLYLPSNVLGWMFSRALLAP